MFLEIQEEVGASPFYQTSRETLPSSEMGLLSRKIFLISFCVLVQCYSVLGQSQEPEKCRSQTAPNVGASLRRVCEGRVLQQASKFLLGGSRFVAIKVFSEYFSSITFSCTSFFEFYSFHFASASLKNCALSSFLQLSSSFDSTFSCCYFHVHLAGHELLRPTTVCRDLMYQRGNVVYTFVSDIHSYVTTNL